MWSQVRDLTPREAFFACVQYLQSTLGAPREEEEQKLCEWGGWHEIWGTDGGLLEATMSESETLTPPKERNRKPNVEIYIWDFQVFRRYWRKDTFIER